MILRDFFLTFFSVTAVFIIMLKPVAQEVLTPDDMMGLTYYARPMQVPPFIFYDERGRAKTLEEYRGKVVVVNLWATWCAPCVVEMPTLDRLQKRFKHLGLEVLTISVDNETTPSMLRGFMREHDLRYLPIYLDPTQRVNVAFDAKTLPSTFVFNKDGQMVASIQGVADWYSQEAQDLIIRELKKESKSQPIQDVYFK